MAAAKLIPTGISRGPKSVQYYAICRGLLVSAEAGGGTGRVDFDSPALGNWWPNNTACGHRRYAGGKRCPELFRAGGAFAARAGILARSERRCGTAKTVNSIAPAMAGYFDVVADLGSA